MKETLRILFLLSLAALAACTTRTADVPPPALDHPDVLAVTSDAALARNYSLGHCSVALNAPAPCVGVRGQQASGIAPGCQHNDCTVAKQNARANLLAGIPAACGAYIRCNQPCRCIRRNNAGQIEESTPEP